jgi:F-type H+-transporting ATPase subunit a
MDLSLDSHVVWQFGMLKINATLVYTWIEMALLTLGSWWARRGLMAHPLAALNRVQNAWESLLSIIRSQVAQIAGEDPDYYFPFVCTLFLFISVANLLSLVPGCHSPTASLSTTAALAVAVLLATPLYGIQRHGLKGYLAHYLQPTPLMLPFHLLAEVTRTVALSVRLFGNAMSGTLIVGLLLSLVPLFFPILMQLLELLIGQVQAYIFAVLATVYLASAARVQIPQK